MAEPERFLRLNAVLYGLGNHEAAWRMPESDPTAHSGAAHWLRLARVCEAAGFDTLFIGDVLALLDRADRHLSDALDPLVLLSAIAVVTERIGLIGTLSTAFEPPFHIARRFASLDHLSAGRAGWNIVTSSNRLEFRNFGLPDLPDHAARYAQAREAVEAAIALWEGWEPDARRPDKAAGRYFDPGKVRAADFRGSFVGTAGPLNVPRSPQGRPLLVQAGSSEAGRDLAARFADLVFTAQPALDEAREFRRDIRRRAAAAGRDPDRILVLPGIMPVIAGTQAEAQRRLDTVDGFILHDHALALLSEYLQLDAGLLDPDGPLPPDLGDARRTEANKGRLALIVDLARRERLTVRRLLQRIGGGRGHLLHAGTAASLADLMEEWLASDAADGFSVMCPVLPSDLETFAALALPELRRRGLLGEPPAGATLRQRLGLTRA